MIRLLLHSRDLKIQAALAPAAGVDFSIAMDSSRERVKRQALDKRCDVVLLDLEGYPLVEQLDFHTELHSLGTAVVVVTDGDPIKMRELERRGIREFCEKPFTLPEFSARRDAHEANNERAVGGQSGP